MEKKKTSVRKKIILLLCVLLIIAGVSVYGVSKLAFGYDVVTWDGEFPFTTNNWYYKTAGKSYCNFTWNGKTVQVTPGTAGFSRGESGNTSTVTVDEFKAAAYLVPQWSRIKVGDTVTWFLSNEATPNFCAMHKF